MIIEQIIIWQFTSQRRIFTNKDVYIKPKRQLINEDDSCLSQTLRKVAEKLKDVIPHHLNEGKVICLSNFLTFYTKKSPKDGSVHPYYDVNGTLATLINIRKEALNPNIQNTLDDISMEISSSLMIQKEVIKALITVFIKAINDLIANGRKISINLSFCLIKLSKQSISCLFAKELIKKLNEVKIDTKKQRIMLHICPTKKCDKRDQQNITTGLKRVYDSKWSEIKQGNLFNRPSLTEIQQLYEKGKELEIKYKDFFE